MNKNKRCSDFELAELTKYPRDIFLPDSNTQLNEFKSFVLTLSVVFNELKDLFWVLQQLENGTPSITKGAKAINSYNGQWSGMRWIIQKNLISFLHEFSQMLLTNRHILEFDISKSVVNEMPYHAQNSWNALVLAIPETRNKKDKFGKFIQRVRDNIGFHFKDIDNYMTGYKAFMKNPSNKNIFHMYASLGDSQEKTRFYFGDAVISGYMSDRYKIDDLKAEDLIRYSRNINNALRFYIESSLNSLLLISETGLY